MVRAPCCEKMGLKKGPWTPEEDQLLVSYIQQHGHGNWRALPKQAGLLRCGKSCRLRWINYLRPDIKRGNFTREDEDTIIQLHQMLGNRWSAIAARLPGRTDNEIKNIWHTNLKKRLNQIAPEKVKRRRSSIKLAKQQLEAKQEPKPEFTETEERPISTSQQCSSDVSSLTTRDDVNSNMISAKVVESSDDQLLPEVDDSFWSEVLSADNSSAGDEFQVNSDDQEHKIPFSPLASGVEAGQCATTSLELNDQMDFWFNLFSGADQELTELPSI